MAAQDSIAHIVQPGEYLYEIAVRYGAKPSDVWSLADNQPLKDTGRTPEILAPGDVVYVPVTKRKFLPLNVGADNAFEATIPTVDVSITLFAPDGTALKDEPYEVVETEARGATLGDGTLSLTKLPLSLKHVTVRLTRINAVMDLDVGHLDPVETLSGKAQRLTHLGYMNSGTIGLGKTSVEDAVQRFLMDADNALTSRKDIEKALREAHGA